MVICGDEDISPFCKRCGSSYYEEMTYGEDAYCSEHDCLCSFGIAECMKEQYEWSVNRNL